ncbi:MAG: PAS domain S-box protein [Promethearchaeota archaeon]|nr:MAG: PAS domain S-box protein [Candidatus Lokiarchaeota archaeon]
MSNIKDEIREKYKDIFEYSLDFIYVNDLKGNFIDANDIALEA